jgi:hypothetical protein
MSILSKERNDSYDPLCIFGRSPTIVNVAARKNIPKSQNLQLTSFHLTPGKLENSRLFPR